MSAPDLFALSNLFVLPGWALLIVAPAWKWTRVVAAYLIPSVLALLWTWVMLARFTPANGGFGSLDEVAALVRDPWLLLAGWIQAMVLALFVGAWAVRDAQRLGIKHRYVVPCLALIFLAGPLGLFIYFLVRAFLVRRTPWA